MKNGELEKSSNIKPSQNLANKFKNSSKQALKTENTNPNINSICAVSNIMSTIQSYRKNVKDNALADKIEKATFEYFEKNSNPITGLTKDRSTANSVASIAATGFSLTAYAIASSHDWISRTQAENYTLKVLETLSKTPQGNQSENVSGFHGFFYHFLNPATGLRADNCEVSTIDTAILMAGVLMTKDYYNEKNNPVEKKIRHLADKLYKRVDWTWALNKKDELSMGYTPEHGFIKTDWHGYNEGSLAILLGLGSPTHPLPKKAWAVYNASDKVVSLDKTKVIEFGPMFGHEYPQIWFDFRHIKDKLNDKLGFTYYANSCREAFIQNEYAILDPKQWLGYNKYNWGLTASDGPGYTVQNFNGKPTVFQAYIARGYPDSLDDGTIAPTASVSALPFAPTIAWPTIKYFMQESPSIYGRYGFKDAFNPSFKINNTYGWVDKDYLGIDEGPILAMLENYQTGLIWDTMKKDKYFNKALKKAGFKKD